MVENGHVNGDVSEGDVTPEIPVKAAPKFDIPTAEVSEIGVNDFMKESLDKVAVAEGFKNYVFITALGPTDGNIGVLFKVTIQEKNSEKRLTVLVKMPPENVMRRMMFGSMGMFKREVLAYTKILPEFVKIQQEKKIKQSDGYFDFPKCYYAEYSEEKDDAILIIEDLTEKGYKMTSKFETTDFEHAKLLFASLGRFHALSFAMKEQKPEVFDEFKKLEDTMILLKIADEGFGMMITEMIHKAVGTLDEKDTTLRGRILRLLDDLPNVMTNLFDAKNAEPFAVLGHGDCWSNNFLYQYKRGRPTNIVLIDYQTTRYCSPVLDLVNFLFICTSSEMRAKHFDELISIYHRSLKDLLDHLGGDTTSQFPLTALLRQLKQFGKFGIVSACVGVPSLCVNTETMEDIGAAVENMTADDPKMMEAMAKAFGATNDKYDSRMRGVLLDALRYKYL